MKFYTKCHKLNINDIINILTCSEGLFRGGCSPQIHDSGDMVAPPTKLMKHSFSSSGTAPKTCLVSMDEVGTTENQEQWTNLAEPIPENSWLGIHVRI